MDKLRIIVIFDRLGADDAEAAEHLGLCPGAYAFGTRMILALADRRLEEVVGFLSDEVVPEPDGEP